MERIEELIVKLKGDVGGWEEVIFGYTCNLARSMAKDLLEKIDEELMRGREEGFEGALGNHPFW